MKTYEGGMPPKAVTYYIYQLAKALKKIHGFDYTHGDVKVSNCLLFKDGEILKLSDLDSLKPIDVKCMSGSRYFADPRVNFCSSFISCLQLCVCIENCIKNWNRFKKVLLL